MRETRGPDEVVLLRPELFQVDAEGRVSLAGSRCEACGTHYFPRRAVCARCRSSQVAPAALSTRGTVYTYTTVHQSTPEFPTPYLLAYVDLPEGVRVLTPVAAAPEQVRIGMTVELRVEPVRRAPDGRAVLGYRAYPVAEVSHVEGLDHRGRHDEVRQAP